MLTQKYSKLYLKIYDTLNTKGNMLKNILNTEEETNVEVLQWEKEQVLIYLGKFKSVSPVGLRKDITVLRHFAEFIIKEEKLVDIKKPSYFRTNFIGKDTLMECTDKEALLSVTLSYEQFRNIRSQLGSISAGETVLYRDKVIFELAWYGLTENEMRQLKKTDIEFIKSKEDMDVIILNIIGGKIVRIDDMEAVEDIKKCIVTDQATRQAKDGRIKTISYRDSEYLLRPIKVGGGANGNGCLKKPSTAFKGAITNNDITCEGIDMFKLSLDDIRRSRLVLLLSKKYENDFDFKTVAALYDLKSEWSVRIYREIAFLKYPPTRE